MRDMSRCTPKCMAGFLILQYQLLEITNFYGSGNFQNQTATFPLPVCDSISSLYIDQLNDHLQYFNNPKRSMDTEQTPSLHKIPEQLIMQNLTHHFLAPSQKPLPYLHYFTKDAEWAINALSYLYNFIRASYHSRAVNQIFMAMLDEEHGVGVVGRIVGSRGNGPVAVKVLLTRYISLPSAMAQYLSTIKQNPAKIESRLVTNICSILPQLDKEQTIFILNKIVTLGHSPILLSTANFDIVLENYCYLTRRDTLLAALVKRVLEGARAEELERVIGRFHGDGGQETVVRVLQQAYFRPCHASPLHLLIKKYPSLLKSILEDLLVWWAQGNDHYLIYNTVKFRTNFLALTIKQMDQDKLILYSSQVSLGIQRRLVYMVQGKREVVQLVMGLLIGRMGLAGQSKGELLEDTVQGVREVQDVQKEQENEGKVMEQKKEQQKGTEQVEKEDQKQPQIFDLVPKAPTNLYDCILGLRNPSRRPITLRLLPKIIRSNPDDLVFVWKDLVTELLYNLQETQQSVIAVFVTRSEPFIDFIGDAFFAKDHSLNDKILLMGILSQGVQELSHQPKAVERDSGHQEFYFKKVSSKYFNEEDKANRERVQKDESRTRRWGHTRIAHQKKLLHPQSSSLNLKILQNEPYINRLYQIANQLFFRIISKLTLLSIFPAQPMFTRPLLQLLGTLSANLKNHVDKYRILGEIAELCYRVVDYVEEKGKKVEPGSKREYLKKWKDTNMAVLQTLNKLSLVIDQYIPDQTLLYLQKSLTKLKSSNEYGINPIINMIQANIYTNVSGQKGIL